MLLQYLLEEVETKKIEGLTTVEIEKIEYDFKRVTKSDLFVLIDDDKQDINQYIDQLVLKGAKAIVLNKNLKYKNPDVTIIYVENTRIALAKLAIKFYDNPASKLKIIGVTGTKGKTTTAYMIRDILLASGKKTGMIGTIYNTYGKNKLVSTKTSPESLDLQRLLRDMVDSGIEYLVMEVTSEAIELNSVYGIKYIISAFTNLSEEHLDFHETMDNYLLAKSKLFEQSDFALINGDDIYSSKLCKMINCKMAKYGLDNEVNITATDIKIGNGKTEFKMYINKALQPIIVNIPGRFTVYNSLAAIGVCSMLGCQIDSIILALSSLKVPGRSEVVELNKTFTVIVDYSNVPSKLEAILLNTKKYTKGRIICVFGCEGEDENIKGTELKEKRMLMGEISGKLSDFTIITSDNPREEDENKIILQIEEGIKKSKGLYKIEKDRKEAIKLALKIAWKNDTIIIAGKGHETYQEFKGGRKIDFDERLIVKEIVEQMPNKNKEE